MDTIALNDLKELATRRTVTAVSLYLPTHPSGDAQSQDSIRLKNLLRQAEDKLEDGGMRRGDARTFLAPIGQLPENAEFWSARSQSLAVFLTPGLFRAFRLPVALEESISVCGRLRIKPLVPVVDRGERFLMLVLGQSHVRFWGVTRSRITEVSVRNLPDTGAAD
jgi:hypothetical protein